MKEILLNAEVRSQVGKGAKKLRRQGQVPGIYYIRGEQAVPVTSSLIAITALGVETEAHIIRLKTNDGVERRCVVREISFDPVSDRPVHFDLLGVRSDEKIRVEIPVLLKGTAIGVRDGGMVQHTMHRMRVECLPDDIPEHIEIDITPLAINNAVHVRDLTLDKVTILESLHATIVSVIPPVVEKAVSPEEAAAAGPAEPEVIKKGKEEKEEE